MYSVNLLPTTLLFYLVPLISGLQVTPGSACAAQCLDLPEGKVSEATASSTIPEDIVCRDSDYATSEAGRKFVSCLDCLSSSTKTEGPESDTAWYLYNLRYAVDVCLFSASSGAHNVSSIKSTTRKRTCDLANTCGPLKTALESNIKSPSNETEFEYCTADNRAFQGKATGECTQCLKQTTDKTYLSNFMVALQAGCQQQPKAGALLGLSGTVFQLSAITASPSPEANTTGSTPVLTMGAIIGIAVGAAVLFIVGAILFIILWRRQHRYKAEDKDARARFPTVRMGLPPQGPTNDHNSLTSYDQFLASPNFTTDYKRRGSDPSTHGNFEKTFANNADYYDQMSNPESVSAKGISDVTTVTAGDAAMPAHPAYIPRTLARPSRTESPKLRQGLPADPRPAHSHDSYALQQYLASGEEPSDPQPQNPASARSIPQSFRSGMASPPTIPLGSPPSRAGVSLASPPARTTSLASPPVTSTSASTSTRQPTNTDTIGSPGKAPSIRSTVSVVPSLILPNLPRKGRRNRNGAAGIFAAGMRRDGPSNGQDISAPISVPDEGRFVDGRVSRLRGESISLPGAGGENDKIVERTLERPTVRGYQEVPIASGKSFLYG